MASRAWKGTGNLCIFPRPGGALSLTATFLAVAMAAAPPSCPDLDRKACVQSMDCMSVVARDDAGRRAYRCVAGGDTCRKGFRQDRRETCSDKPGCRFVPAGPCYCPPDVVCVCGGGPPPDCVPDGAGETSN